MSVPCFDRRDGSLLYPAPGFGASSWRTARVLWLTATGPWALRRDEVSPRFLVQPAGAEQPLETYTADFRAGEG